MTEWWTYRPADLLLFSERVYWRLFELHNAALWPAQILALLVGATILALVLRPRAGSNRFIGLALAAAWTVVAWTFLWYRYRTINWAASYAVLFFMVEALLLAWLAGIRGRVTFEARRDTGSVLALGLFVYALAVHPFVAVIAGRPLAGAEIFALTPDATAIATLGLLGLANGRRAVWPLLVVPVAWCAVSGATLHTMGTWEAWLPLIAVAVALAARLWTKDRRVR